MLIWQLADCRVTEEGEWFASRARCHNKGVLDEYRGSKAAYDAMKEKFEAGGVKGRKLSGAWAETPEN